MDKQSDDKKRTFFSALSNYYSGSITHVALAALSAWMMVTGLKGLAGFTVNEQTALADLVGVVIVIGVARWFKVRQDTK